MLSPTAPPHIGIAAQYLGQRETEAMNKSPFIRSIWARFGVGWLLGQPWCGGFVAHCLDVCSLPYVKTFYRALDWAKYGGGQIAPHEGCIGVIRRKGGGHVGFIVGQTIIAGELFYLLLGGNQGDSVSVVTVKSSDFECYRSVPDGLTKYPLPTFGSKMVAALKQGGIFT